MKKNIIIGLVGLIIGSFSSPSSGFADVDSGLVGYWSFDEGQGDVVHDYSGNGNDGTIYGAIWTAGAVGSALYFDGEDDYVDCGNNQIFGMDYPVTLVAWIAKEPGGGFGGQGNVGIITTDRTPGYYSGYVLETHRVVDDYYPLSTGFGDGTGGGGPDYRRSKNSSPLIGDSTWYHVAGVVRGPHNMSIYVNGVDVGGSYSGLGGEVEWLGGPCVIGCSWYYDYYFKGVIDEVRIYDRELSEAEVDSLYSRVQPPMAFIDDICPNPAEEGHEVFFSGHGEDTNGSVVGYRWRSSLDGYLSSDSSFSLSSLFAGTHTIFFKVEDDAGLWSKEDSMDLKIIGGTIVGTVTSTETADPIEGVEVAALNTPSSAQTDIDGEYSLDVLSGSYDVSFNHPLYYDTTVTGVTVTFGDTIVLNMALRRSYYFVRCDAQADGDHDLFDAIFIFNWLGGLVEITCIDAADCQDDGDADIFDALYLLNWLGGI